jgi:hypothetical protein
MRIYLSFRHENEDLADTVAEPVTVATEVTPDGTASAGTTAAAG